MHAVAEQIRQKLLDFDGHDRGDLSEVHIANSAAIMYNDLTLTDDELHFVQYHMTTTMVAMVKKFKSGGIPLPENYDREKNPAFTILLRRLFHLI